MTPFIERLIEEKKELDEKKAKLSDFLTSGKINSVDFMQAQLLQMQYSIMQTYSDTLKMRINLLTQKPTV